MNKKRTFVDVFFFAAFLLALGVRLIHLGAEPLSDLEAASALQALDLSGAGAGDVAPQPVYLALTGATFTLLGPSNFLARLWPALAGSLLLLAPYLLRKRLGREAALFLAFGLALDPGLVALSRLAAGPMLAIGFGALALASMYLRKPAWSGLFIGLALLSGPAVWLGLLGLGITWGVTRLLGLSLGLETDSTTEASDPPASFSQSKLSTWIIFTAGTLLLVGTLFFSFPAGLGAFGRSLATFLRGWGLPSGVPLGQSLTALLVFAPLALIFALVALAQQGWRNGWLVWALAALLLATVYPARGVGDVAWAILPLWVLAGRALAARYRLDDWKNPTSWALAAAILVLMALIWLTLAGMYFTPMEGRGLRWLMIAGILTLIGLVVVFVGLGWSWRAARGGAVLGLLIALGLYTVAAMVGASQVRPGSAAELWYPSPATGQANLMRATLQDLSLRETGMKTALDGAVLVDSLALRWALRGFSEIDFRSSLGEPPLPSVVIAPLESESSAWTGAYRGQDFGWRIYPVWQRSLPSNWVDWLVFRDAPVEKEYVILWVRGDLFSDEPAQAQEDAAQPDSP